MSVRATIYVAHVDRPLLDVLYAIPSTRPECGGWVYLLSPSPSHHHEHDHNTRIFVYAITDMGPHDLASFRRDPAVVDHPVRLKNEHPISKEPYEVHEPALLRAFLRFDGGRVPCSV